MAAGIVTGIGFLGAGVILREGYTVRGITTAAAIWAVAALGMAAALKLYLAAGVGTLMVMGMLAARPLTRGLSQALRRHLGLEAAATGDEEHG